MKFSESWLRAWVDPDLSTEDLIAQLTMAGLEVDSVDPLEIPFEGPVVIARIEALEPHPDMPSLRICRASLGDETVSVVCGAENARAGMVSVLARPGAVLGEGPEVELREFGDATSEGVFCSAKELGLSDEDSGIIELNPEAPVGELLTDALALHDQIIDIDLTPNRGDCLGISGIAREVGALNQCTVKPADIPSIEPACEDIVKIEVQANQACPAYTGRVIRDINIQASAPLWLTERLRRSGIRSIDPVVDVTNYVMLELGQPMHAFDLATLQGGIRVRIAEQGETLTLLNGDELTLEAGTLIIADHAGPLALAGIMGGAKSGTSAETRDLFLEAAFFNPLSIAGRARGHGLATDSSHRFERGVDPQVQRDAIERATELLLQIVGGKPGPLVSANSPDQLPGRQSLTLRRDRLDRVMGMQTDPGFVTDLFQRMGFEVEEQADRQWHITPPSWRFDIALQEDLIEEVARIYGYNRLPSALPSGTNQMRRVSEDRVPLRSLRRHLVSRGYQEAVTYSFVDPHLQQLIDPGLGPVPLSNPISSEMSVMRTSLWPGLLQTLQFNQNRQSERVRVFETGLCFLMQDDQLDQIHRLGMLVAGSREPEHWSQERGQLDFFDLKGDLESLLGLTGAADEIGFSAAEHAALHPGQSAQILRNGTALGWIGALHPAIQAKLDLEGPVIVAELDLSLATNARKPQFSELSRFPEVRRDLAIVVKRAVPAGTLENDVRDAAGEHLTNLVLFDVYEGEGIDPDKKSVGLGLTFQHPSHTLNEDEIKQIVDRVLEKLASDHEAVLRA